MMDSENYLVKLQCEADPIYFTRIPGEHRRSSDCASKEILALDHLKERLPTLPTELTSDAWLGVGIK